MISSDGGDVYRATEASSCVGQYVPTRFKLLFWSGRDESFHSQALCESQAPEHGLVGAPEQAMGVVDQATALIMAIVRYSGHLEEAMENDVQSNSVFSYRVFT